MTVEQHVLQKIQDVFPKISELSQENGLDLVSHLQERHFTAGTTLVHQGDICTQHMMIIEGVVKVFTRTENGREIVLYRVTEGECCVLTTSCLLGHTPFPVEGEAETDVHAVAIPAEYFNQGLEQSSLFREFVFSAYTQRLTEIIALIGEIASVKIDRRLATSLLQHCQGCSAIKITHDALAKELGTAREVISRNLKEFEQQGWLKLGRGTIQLTNRDELEKFNKTVLM
ncbi:MAG: Crp/Fnr family transcriptional regulator [Methylococcales bacterium]|jgi:CRP/FNR family transcriptional regulator, anaerobic regulatory protein|nr:Crp/Fnr family transcriptional regulator [Methylococcales bacterium]